jgi:diguanylate cyclase (GGDEF)-like protein
MRRTMTLYAADDAGLDMPSDVAGRLLRALDRAPSTVVSFVDADLTTRWLSRSAAWVMDTDPTDRAGRGSLERVHPDDADRLLHALAQVRAASRDDAPMAVIEPLRYRKLRADGTWIAMEAQVLNLLDDPEVEGLVFVSRPVGGEAEDVGHVIDLLVADAPLPDVLAACAGLVPDYLGSAAIVALVDGSPVFGAVEGSPAAGLVGDARWWRPVLDDGRVLEPGDFSGFPGDLAERARAEGFRSAWVIPLPDASTGESMGCIAVWVSIAVERNIAIDHTLRQTARLASLVIGEQRRHHVLRREAVTDPLTAVGNRSALRRRLEAAPGEVTVAVLDLDDFKPVNDTYGHQAGDVVLRVVAERLVDAVREDDLVVRLGGDEFAIVFADGTSGAGATHSVDRVMRTIRQPIDCDRGLVVSVAASVGLATGRPPEVMRRADAGLYEAKRDRRGAPAVASGSFVEL